MIEFPIAELMDDSMCTLWLERHLHPQGLTCPHCGHPDKRLFRAHGHFPVPMIGPHPQHHLARDGEQRWWVCDHADTRTCATLIAENIPAGSTGAYTDEWQSYRGSHPAPATVRHGVHEWARDDDGDGRREVHSHSWEGTGAVLRSYLRAFRGVHT